MGVLSCPEIREVAISPREKAILHDRRVREIDQIVRESWSELAAICIQVRDRQEWRLLTRGRPRLDVDREYHSFDDWLMDAAPVCRATVYKGMGILSVLAQDMDQEQIAGIEIGNATLLAQVSAAVRRDPEVIEAAKSGRHSKKLRDVVRKKYPDQHIEAIVEKKLHFTSSQWDVIASAYENYALTNDGASLEQFFEFAVSWIPE
jgi:hypothetical protein